MPLPDGGFDAVICLEAAGDICVRTADKPRLLAELRRMLRPGGQVGFSDLVFDRPPTAAEDRALRALLYHSARELLTDWPGLFAAAGFQLGTVRDIQAQTLPAGQHVQAVYRQHAAQIRVRYGRRLGPGVDRQVAQVAAAIRRCGSYPALSATAPSTPPASLPAVHPSARTPAGSPGPLRLPSRGGLLPWPERARRRCRRDTGRCRGPAAAHCSCAAR